MKKILLILLLFIFSAPLFAADLSFIYINGSNNNNQKMKNWYEKGVKKLHPVLRKKMLNNRAIKHYYSKIGSLNIKEEPVIFFWGYESKNDLDFVKKQLEVSKMVSSSGAYIVRNLLTQYMHDAIWVQKSHNMMPILEELNKAVKEEAEDGDKIILYGYSAGTFVAYQYMFNKFRYINLIDLFENLKADEDVISFVKEHPMNNTCLSALSRRYAGVGMFTADGHFILNPNKNDLKNGYLKMNEATEEACAPNDMVMGVVNFASPLPLFYSDMADKDYEMNYYNRIMTKYIFENGIFSLTVNFREDPLGFPSSRNLAVDDIDDIIDLTIENPTGVMYDNSGVWSKRIFPLAHTSYWSARKTFANAITKSFVNGYKFHYDEEYQAKVIKKKRKRSEL